MKIIQIYKMEIIYCLLILVSCLVFSFSKQAQSQEIQITTDLADQGGPDIWGDYIVYGDKRNGNPDIWLFNLSNSSEIQITTDPNKQVSPKIYQDKIVYEDNRNGNLDIYLFDLSTGIEQQITTDPDIQCSPDIYGERIIWVDRRNDHPCLDPYGDHEPDPDIFSYSLSTLQESMVLDGAPYDCHPTLAIWGDKFVSSTEGPCWVDCVNGGYIGCLGPYEAIIMYDFTNSITNTISGFASLFPYILSDIYENLVVYNLDDGLYVYDLSTSEEVLINSDRGEYPKIYGDNIVYLRWKGYYPYYYDIYIYLYDLLTSTETQLPIEPVLVGTPAIYENKIVYTADRYGNKDIFMYVLEDCSSLDCDDGDVCTDDSCNPVYGCVHTDNTNPCDDGLFCTESDVCSNGVCSGSTVDCDDENECTYDGPCNETLEICPHVPELIGVPCTGGICDGMGNCVSGGGGYDDDQSCGFIIADPINFKNIGGLILIYAIPFLLLFYLKIRAKRNRFHAS